MDLFERKIKYEELDNFLKENPSYSAKKAGATIGLSKDIVKGYYSWRQTRQRHGFDVAPLILSSTFKNNQLKAGVKPPKETKVEFIDTEPLKKETPKKKSNAKVAMFYGSPNDIADILKGLE